MVPFEVPFEVEVDERALAAPRPLIVGSVDGMMVGLDMLDEREGKDDEICECEDEKKKIN